jgi:hypothetical protein
LSRFYCDFEAALGDWLVGAAVGLILAAAICLYDATGYPGLTLDRLGEVGLRIWATWLPIACLSNTNWIRRQGAIVRFVALLLAYLMQASVVPASLDRVGVGTRLALAIGPLLVLVAMWWPRTELAHPPTNLDADRNPR